MDFLAYLRAWDLCLVLMRALNVCFYERERTVGSSLLACSARYLGLYVAVSSSAGVRRRVKTGGGTRLLYTMCHLRILYKKASVLHVKKTTDVSTIYIY